MRLNFFDIWEIEIDWKAIMAIAITFLAYAIIK